MPGPNDHGSNAVAKPRRESAFAEQHHAEVNEWDCKGPKAGVCASMLEAFGGLGTATGTVWVQSTDSSTTFPGEMVK